MFSLLFYKILLHSKMKVIFFWISQSPNLDIQLNSSYVSLYIFQTNFWSHNFFIVFISIKEYIMKKYNLEATMEVVRITARL